MANRTVEADVQSRRVGPGEYHLILRVGRARLRVGRVVCTARKSWHVILNDVQGREVYMTLRGLRTAAMAMHRAFNLLDSRKETSLPISQRRYVDRLDRERDDDERIPL